ncbi:hypothetical protein Tsubulata_040560, partial [Turnera subulata]
LAFSSSSPNPLSRLNHSLFFSKTPSRNREFFFFSNPSLPPSTPSKPPSKPPPSISSLFWSFPDQVPRRLNLFWQGRPRLQLDRKTIARTEAKEPVSGSGWNDGEEGNGWR